MKLLVTIGGTSFELHTDEIGEACDFAHTFVHDHQAVSATDGQPIKIELIDVIGNIDPAPTAFANRHNFSPAARPDEADPIVDTDDPAGPQNMGMGDLSQQTASMLNQRYDNYETFYSRWIATKPALPTMQACFEAGKELGLQKCQETVRLQAKRIGDLEDKANDYYCKIVKLNAQVQQDLDAMAQAQQAISELQRDNEKLIAQRAELGQVVQALQYERETLVEANQLKANRIHELVTANQNISTHRDADAARYQAALKAHGKERDALAEENERLQKCQDKLNRKYQRALDKLNQMAAKRDELAATIDDLSTKATALVMQAEVNEEKYTQLQKYLIALNNQYHELGRQKSAISKVLAQNADGLLEALCVLKVWPTEHGIEVTVEKTWKD